MRPLPGKAGKEKTIIYFSWLLILFVFLADRLLKIWIIERFDEGAGFVILDPWLRFTHVSNTGAAFGLWRDASGVLTLFSGVSVILISLHLTGLLAKSSAQKTLPVPHAPAWALVAGGALGNLYDRLILGYVVDYIDLRIWPVFNFADVCICSGVAWILFAYFQENAAQKKKHDASHPL